MTPTVTALRTYQAGIQSVAGTPVAATAKLAVEELQFSPIDLVHRPQIARGVAIRNRGKNFVTRRGTAWTARGPFVWEQFQLWLAMAIAGGVEATDDESPPPYVWTYTANPLVVHVPDYVTLERRRTDGSSPVDEEVSDCVVTQIRLARGADARLDMEISGFGRRIASSTLTASQDMGEILGAPAGLSAVFINDDWASLGNTAVAAQVLDWSWTYSSGFFPVYTADGIDNLDFTAVGFNPDACDVRVEATLRVAAQMATEKAKAEAVGLRALRIALEGPDSRAAAIDQLLEHEAGSLAELGTQDGEDIVQLAMVGASDDTNFLQFALTNLTDEPDGNVVAA